MTLATFYFRGVRFELGELGLRVERDGVTYAITWATPSGPREQPQHEAKASDESNAD